MIDEITAARDAALADIATADSVDAVAAMTTRYAGKKGELAGLKKQLGGLVHLHSDIKDRENLPENREHIFLQNLSSTGRL